MANRHFTSSFHGHDDDAVLPRHPYHPLIYVRGFAATQNEIENAVADPYMGFNIGSTKTRMAWTGDVRRFFFESPLVRLMSDHDYQDVYVDGDDLLAAKHASQPVPYRSIVIYRYYDEASSDFGTGETPPIEHFARGLSELILNLRDKVCANPKNAMEPKDFRVYLVAHSMGGLICRAFLQNPRLGSDQARAAVDKLFTYATPHNGIDMRIVRNVPGWLAFGDINNFNRERMAKYLGLASSDDVSVVQGFAPERIFNLVGTNSRDYTVAGGLSSWVVGEASDGLVRIENATTHGPGKNGEDITSPRAFVHRSHSGPYGIVNSEEGYQNLVRFLFGQLRVDGVLEIDDISLPVEVQKAKDEGKTIRASYQFEVVVSIRGTQWQMTRREVRENSAIFRRFADLFPGRSSSADAPDSPRSPYLFSVFLDAAQSVKASRSVSFAVDLKVLVPDYEVDGRLFRQRHYEGGFILQRQILIEVFPDFSDLSKSRVRYGFQETNPGKPGIVAQTHAIGGGAEPSGLTFTIPLEQKTRPGFQGKLRVRARQWH
jgi:hypothetical protein